jgi:molybdopterin molybdotransferase
VQVHQQALEFLAARRLVIETVAAAAPRPPVESVALSEAAGRILAQNILADRDYPPTDRSIRDGFACRAADLPGALDIIGEVRAGESFSGRLQPGQTVRIMTGAPLPEGADCVVMVEHAAVEAGKMSTDRAPEPGEYINRAGCEARAAEPVLEKGVRLDYRHVAMLATVGAANVPVCKQLRVAILATGDEIVPVEAVPKDFEIRNSNSHALAAQVARAGAIPEILPVAPDDLDSTIFLIEQGLQADMLLLSGGVSAGEYDYVEAALARCGAEFFFTRVKMRPGAPAVFGRARETFFFGLPGNPLSTAVTFEVFARAALELLSGMAWTTLPIVEARLTEPLQEKPGLTRFLPALLHDGGASVTPIHWKGSSDVPSLARSNAYIVSEPHEELHPAGEYVRVLLR